jgi:hypothetical protein
MGRHQDAPSRSWSLKRRSGCFPALPYPPLRPLTCYVNSLWIFNHADSHRLPSGFSLFTSLLELTIPFSKDLVFVGMPWKPRFSLRFDIASGDKDPKNPRLQSFNPLFPCNSYSGIAGLLGPTSLTDLTPAVTVAVRPNLVMSVEAPSYWRTSEADGVYSTDLRVLLQADEGMGKYVGTNPGYIVVWQATRHIQIQGAITRFLSADFLKNTFVAEGFGFFSGTFLYRF